MRVLTLRHKGYSLKLVFRANTYYTKKVFEPSKTPFTPGKTMYQILFEHLIDGKTVSCRGLSAHYKNVNPDISPAAILPMLRRIEVAAKSSHDKQLRKMRFKRMPRGGASPVISRKSIFSRFTPTQREIIEKKIGQLHKQGKTPRYQKIREVCLKALRKKGLAENVVLSDLAICKAKMKLGLPIRPAPGSRRLRRRR